MWSLWIRLVAAARTPFMASLEESPRYLRAEASQQKLMRRGDRTTLTREKATSGRSHAT
jgi:hypothetical protein